MGSTVCGFFGEKKTYTANQKNRDRKEAGYLHCGKRFQSDFVVKSDQLNNV